MTTRRRQAGRTRFSGRPKRGVFWNDTGINRTIAASAQTIDILDADVIDDLRKGLTLVRLIVKLTLMAITAGTGTALSLGFYVAEDDAVSAAAVADPEDGGENPGWIHRAIQIPVFTSTVNDYSQARHIDIDTTAKRRYMDDTNLIMVITLNAGASSINVDGHVRQLLMRA